MAKEKVVIDGITYYRQKDGEPETTVVPEVEPEKKPVAGSEVADEEKLEKAADEAAQKILASLGIKELQDKVDQLKSAMESAKPSNKSALLDLETLMKKDLSQMTAREKIIGFFQAMVSRNDAAMKALSEGTAADGGYLFPKFIGA